MNGRTTLWAIALIVVAFAVSTLIPRPEPAQALQNAGIRQWQHLVLGSIDIKGDLAKTLNEAGAAGWELVAVEVTENGERYFFKRPS